MKLKSATLAGLAALLGALWAPCARADVPKTSTAGVIVSDLFSGAGGMRATSGADELDGALGQLSQSVEASGADVLEAGYFSRLVLPPTSLLPGAPLGSTQTFSWSDATPANPAGTAYIVEMSTDAGFGGTLISSSAIAFAGTVTGLTGNTTYFSRVRAAYSEGDDSSNVSFGQSVTQAIVPSDGKFFDSAPFTLRTQWDPSINTVGLLAGAWSTGGMTSLPAVRQGAAMVHYGGRLYASGGSDPTAQNTVHFASILADGSVGAWTATTPLPAIREAHAMVAWAGRLYVAGGSAGGTNANSTVWSAPILANGGVGEWTTTTSLPAARNRLAMIAWGGVLVVTGGDNGAGAQSTVYMSTINADGTLTPWTTEIALPTPIRGHSMNIAGGYMHITGGETPVVTNAVWRATMVGDSIGTWTAEAAMPAALTRHAMAAANGKLYVTGGSDAGSTLQSTTYIGHLSTSGLVTSWTLAAATLPPVFQHAMAASMDRLYVAGGNIGVPSGSVLSTPLSGTQSLAELSLTSGFGTIASSSSWRAGTSFDFPDLSPNTTYFARISARNYSGAQTAFLSLGSTMTLAAMPGAAVSTFTGVSLSSIDVQWSAGANPGGTFFRAQASTAPDFSGTMLASDWLTAVSTSFAGLPINTSYYVRVQARNAVQAPTAFAVLGATFTLADMPVGSTITATPPSGLTMTWSPAGNPAGTRFEAQVSVSPIFTTVMQSSVTFASTATFSGLISGNNLYARVRALNGSGVPSAFDAILSTTTGVDAVAPGASTGTFAIPGNAANSLNAIWVVSGNDGYAGTLFAGSTFYLQWSTSPPASVTWSTAAAQVVVSTGPLAPGAWASVAVAALPSRKEVFFTQWTSDTAGNYSAPSATFSAITTPFNLETLAGGGGFDAGTSPSLVVDKAGNLHAAYRGTTGTQQLQYAKRTAGFWSAPTVVDADVVSNVVLTLDASDNPVIAYYNATAVQMKVARFNGSWTLSVVETGSFQPGGAAVDAAGAVNVSYFDAGGNRLKFARSTGTVWSTEIVDNSSADVGRESALALDAAQQPYISYYDATNMFVKLASATAGGGWTLRNVAAGVTLSSNTTIALDGKGGVHVAFADSGSDAVTYASMTTGAFALTIIEPGPGFSGSRISLALDGSGAAHVSYGNRAARTLKFAQWTGTSFSTQTLDASADHGIESSLALDGAGEAHIAYRDATNKMLKAAHSAGAGLVPAFGGNARGRAQAASGMGGAVLSLTSIQWTWTDNASNEQGFRLYGSQTSTGPFTLVAGTATIAATPGSGSITSFVETGLTTGATYFRYAVAVGTGSDVTAPSIVNGQTGDNVKRRTNTGIYNVTFFDSGGSNLSHFTVTASTVPGGAGPFLIAHTTVASAINAANYPTPWPLPAAVFNALQGGVTNYITVKVSDNAGNITTGNDLFYVLRDTSVPSITGHVVQASSVGITAVQVDCFDQSGTLQVTAFTAADGSGTFVLNGVPLSASRIQATWAANGVSNSVSIDSVPVDSTNIDFVLQLDYILATVQGNLATLSVAHASLSTLSVGMRAASYFDPKAVPSATDARVELYQGGRQVGEVPVQTNGHWIIPNLLPGTYSLRAFNGIGYTDFQTVELIDGEIRSVNFLSTPLADDQVFAFPNPARRSTTIRFQSALLPLDAQIRIFDLTGALVKELTTANGTVRLANVATGVYHADWDLRNSQGQGVASGVYLFAVKVKGGTNQIATVMKKLAVVK